MENDINNFVILEFHANFALRIFKRKSMEKLVGYQLNRLVGGGHWVQLASGDWIYIDDDDEPGDSNDIIYS